MSGQCCCIHHQNPSDEPDCWPVSSPEQCPVSRDCAYRSGLPVVHCVAARMTNQHLVTPFLDQPEMLSAVSDTYRSMYDVRSMLKTSDLGRRVLDYGKTVSDETARIVAEAPELGSRVFETLMKALSFARAMDRERLSPGSLPYERRFTEVDYVFGARVADEVRARTDDPALIAALDDLREQAARFIGMTPAEALSVLDDNGKSGVYDERLQIGSIQELQRREQEVLDRVRAMPNGERLFLAHPLRALADAGIDLSDDAVAGILQLYPNLAEAPTTAYDALKASPEPQSETIRLDGLFNWGQQ